MKQANTFDAAFDPETSARSSTSFDEEACSSQVFGAGRRCTGWDFLLNGLGLSNVWQQQLQQQAAALAVISSLSRSAQRLRALPQEKRSFRSMDGEAAWCRQLAGKISATLCQKSHALAGKSLKPNPPSWKCSNSTLKSRGSWAWLQVPRQRHRARDSTPRGGLRFLCKVSLLSLGSEFLAFWRALALIPVGAQCNVSASGGKERLCLGSGRLSKAASGYMI